MWEHLFELQGRVSGPGTPPFSCDKFAKSGQFLRVRPSRIKFCWFSHSISA